MANALYTKLITTVSSYLGDERAKTTIERQLARCQFTPETVTEENLRTIMAHVVGATTLHLAPDKAKQQALKDKLKAMV